MFTYASDLKFTHVVPVDVPSDVGHEEQTLKVRFRVLGDTEVADYDMNDKASTNAFLRAVIDHIDDVVDANKSPITYSDTLRDMLLDLPFVRVALVKGYFRGMFKAGSGN